MTFGRRKFIIGSVGAGAVSSLIGSGCADSNGGDGGGDHGDGMPIDGSMLASAAVDTQTFAHGVASADPLSDRVLLWTRVSMEGEDAVEVSWVITSDPELTQVVNKGTAMTDALTDYTVKVDADKLQPGTTYYYAFGVADGRSVTGRTRTLPAAGIDHLRIVFTSCANFNNGYFNAYRAIANRQDIDVWVHLGDYIYEYADAKAEPDNSYGDPSLTDRAYVPTKECITLEDYRTRHAQYRTDKDLQEIHRQIPIISVWDDHETANNAWMGGAENHMPATEGDWPTRQEAGTQAYLEWVPTRSMKGTTIDKIYRSFEFGGLFDLIMLDTRQLARSQQVEVSSVPGQDPPEWDDPSRTILGDEQEQWFIAQLKDSRARNTIWRLIGNQVIISPVHDPLMRAATFADFWEGYRAERTRIFQQIVDDGIDNMVFMTGDIHTSWAIDLAQDPWDPAKYDPATGMGGFGVELVGPSITSLALEGDPTADIVPTLVSDANPQVKFSEVTRKGYVLVDVTPAQVQAEWYFVNTIKMPNMPGESLYKAYVCKAGAHHLEEVTTPTVAKASPPAFAPAASTASAALLAHNAAE
ncbi:MAG: alkaline phosphatase D family protein [Myxococcales bacterium]